MRWLLKWATHLLPRLRSLRTNSWSSAPQSCLAWFLQVFVVFFVLLVFTVSGPFGCATKINLFSRVSKLPLIRSKHKQGKQASKQRNKQGKQTSKQTGKQTNKQTNKENKAQTKNKQTNKQLVLVLVLFSCLHLCMCLFCSRACTCACACSVLVLALVHVLVYALVVVVQCSLTLHS